MWHIALTICERLTTSLLPSPNLPINHSLTLLSPIYTVTQDFSFTSYFSSIFLLPSYYNGILLIKNRRNAQERTAET